MNNDVIRLHGDRNQHKNMTSHLPPDVVAEFLNGSTPPVMRMTLGADSTSLQFSRGGNGIVPLLLPLAPHPESAPFDMLRAIEDAHFTVEHSVGTNSIEFKIHSRGDLRNVISVATNYLN